MEQDRERQLRDKHLLDRWPSISCAEILRPLHKGISIAAEILNLSTPNSLAVYTWVRGRKVAKGMRKVLEERGLWRPGKKFKLDTLYFSTRH